MKKPKTPKKSPTKAKRRLPFPTTDDQVAKVSSIAEAMKKAGLDHDLIADASRVARIDQGVYDLLALWREAEGHPNLQKQVVAILDDLRASLADHGVPSAPAGPLVAEVPIDLLRRLRTTLLATPHKDEARALQRTSDLALLSKAIEAAKTRDPSLAQIRKALGLISEATLSQIAPHVADLKADLLRLHREKIGLIDRLAELHAMTAEATGCLRVHSPEETADCIADAIRFERAESLGSINEAQGRKP